MANELPKEEIGSDVTEQNDSKLRDAGESAPAQR